VTSVKITREYARRVFLNWLTGWSWSLTLLANGAVAPLIGMAIWSSATAGNRQVITYFAALLIVSRFTSAYSAYTFSGTIYDGGLSDALLRPHPVVLSEFGWYFGIVAFDLLFLAPVIIALGVLTPAHLDWGRAALAIPAAVLAAGCGFAFTFALALSAFWTERYFAVADSGARLVFLFGGVAAPIPLLPSGVRPWFNAMPFRWMRGFPAEVASGMVRGREIAVGFAFQLVWLIVLSLACAAVYRAGIRRYTALGG
jgi:ABC-2 type transport system permease protein